MPSGKWTAGIGNVKIYHAAERLESLKVEASRADFEKAAQASAQREQSEEFNTS
ncbi:hypothetical protein [Bythopirellula polymerisocia]|uniref:hypothetical protein n=1 Tax=Bythopirellula polymerisocia TaxID=2528003 RepID=UPI0018D35628|nr:hypothetical protein [Bythopirellula polymerisocia]